MNEVAVAGHDVMPGGQSTPTPNLTGTCKLPPLPAIFVLLDLFLFFGLLIHPPQYLPIYYVFQQRAPEPSPRW